MKSNCKLILAIIVICCSCKEGNTGFDMSLNSKTELDTIYISELITNKSITKIYETNEIETVQLNNPSIAVIHSKNNDKEYLTILAPNKDLNISILSDSSITTNDISDSLVNYLWQSNSKFISENNSFIAKTENKDSIPILFEKYIRKRENEINKFKDQFSPEVANMLHFQNYARIYAYLFNFGRVYNVINPKNSYFDFIENIPEATEILKSLPHIYIYKYEVEYLREHQSIESVSDFLRFIEQKTNNKDLADFLKAIYIKSLIEMPSYWQKHEKLFNSVILSEVLNAEKNNTHYHLIEQPSASFYATQNGKPAYLFQAEDKIGNSFNLESLKGKVIFIDTWATWCGPCIAHRPKVLEFAKKYKDNDAVEILLVSVDSSKDNWLSFLEKENKDFGTNLFIESGMSSNYGNSYNIKSIPRYILIGKNGKIINSNINEPSISVEKEIENAMNK